MTAVGARRAYGGADRPVEDVRQLLGDGHRLARSREATSLYRLCRSTSCWYEPPIALRCGLADDRHHRHMVELGVVQPVEQVDRARARGRRAHAEPAGELGVADRLEGGHLLVPGLDEPRPVVGPPPGREQPVDAVARVAEDVLDVPLAQPCARCGRRPWCSYWNLPGCDLPSESPSGEKGKLRMCLLGMIRGRRITVLRTGGTSVGAAIPRHGCVLSCVRARLPR